MHKPIVILGYGGFAREVLDVCLAIKSTGQFMEVGGFVVEDKFRPGVEKVHDVPIVGGLQWLKENAYRVTAVCALGAPESRYEMVQKASDTGVEFTSIIHPRATYSPWVEIGAGSVLTAGVCLTNEIRIGKHSHINLNCTIGHDVNIGQYCTLSPGANISGNVRIDEGSLIGTGAAIVERVSIGSWAKIGAGAVVLGDVPSNSTAVGSPSRVVKTRPEGWHLREQ